MVATLLVKWKLCYHNNLQAYRRERNVAIFKQTSAHLCLQTSITTTNTSLKEKIMKIVQQILSAISVVCQSCFRTAQQCLQNVCYPSSLRVCVQRQVCVLRCVPAIRQCKHKMVKRQRICKHTYIHNNTCIRTHVSCVHKIAGVTVEAPCFMQIFAMNFVLIHLM